MIYNVKNRLRTNHNVFAVILLPLFICDIYFSSISVCIYIYMICMLLVVVYVIKTVIQYTPGCLVCRFADYILPKCLLEKHDGKNSVCMFNKHRSWSLDRAWGNKNTVLLVKEKVVRRNLNNFATPIAFECLRHGSLERFTVYPIRNMIVCQWRN